MLNFFRFYLLALLFLISFSGPVFAADDLSKQIANQSGYTTAGVTEYTLSEMIGQGIKIVLGFVGTIFFALTVYAGYLWMTAQGNSDQVEKAKDILKMAVVGIIIVVAAYSITAFILIYTSQVTTLSSPVGQ